MRGARKERSCVDNVKDEDERALLVKDAAKLLDYSRSEMLKLQKENGEYRVEVRKIAHKNAKFSDIHQSFESALTVSDRRVEQLEKSNGALVSETIKSSRKYAKVKKQLKAHTKQHNLDIKVVQSNFVREIVAQKEKMPKISKELEKAKYLHEREMLRFRKEMEETRKAQEAQILEMKDELDNVQAAHDDYLSKLMQMLESAHLSHETETILQRQEFEGKLGFKNNKILRLRNDLAALKYNAQR